MTLATDIADDYLFFDGLESVTLTPRSAGVDGTPVTSVSALRGPTLTVPRNNEAATLDEVSAGTWELFTATLGATVPAPGDKITDASSVSWRIVGVRTLTLGSRFQCDVIRELS